MKGAPMAGGTLDCEGEEINYEVRTLQETDAVSIMELEGQIVAELGLELYVPYEEERLVKVLSDSFSLGAFVGERLIAARTVEAPSVLDSTSLRRFPIPEGESMSIASFCGVVVRSEFRKQALARTLATLSLEQLRDKCFKHVYATVSPFNVPSLQYMFSLGFRALDRQNKYGGKARLLLYRNTDIELPDIPESIAVVDATSEERQEKLFADGQRVWKVAQDGEKVELHFGS